MAVPTSRSEFKDYCLRKLGVPVIEVNISDEQIEDRIDEALQYFWDFHGEGSDKMYYKHVLTNTDIQNQYIILPENIMGAVRLYDPSGIYSSSDYMFDIRYQIAVNDLYTLTNVSLVPYFTAMQHLSLIQELLIPDALIRYNKHKDQLHLDMNWNRVREGSILVVEAFEVIDPDVYTDVWSDRWLQRYCCALLQEQFGKHLTKHIITLPGGVQINGEFLYSEGKAAKEQLEEEMRTTYSLPPSDFIY